MTTKKPARILVDGREFQPERKTGIARFLEGLLDAMETSTLDIMIILACHYTPTELLNKKKIKIEKISRPFLFSEWALSKMTKQDIDLFISPYPKLPIFGCYCPSIHIIHDILDLTHPAYRKRLNTLFDGWRLKKALKKADLTWYDSDWSLRETKKYAGFTGKNPRVRHPGIDEKFRIEESGNQNEVLSKYNLRPGYVLVIGNGRPHKNLGVLLSIVDQLNRNLVFVGVPPRNQGYWKTRFQESKTRWIPYIHDEDMPTILQGAFCLAQPSTAEGYGYPPLEAMACGVPAVVSNISVLLETTGSNTLTADLKRPNAWIEAFKALEDEFIYKEQVENCLKWVEPLRGRKGWQKHVEDIENLLKRS